MSHTGIVSSFSMEELVTITTVLTLQLLVTVTSNSNSKDTKTVPKSHQITFL